MILTKLRQAHGYSDTDTESRHTHRHDSKALGSHSAYGLSYTDPLLGPSQHLHLGYES